MTKSFEISNKNAKGFIVVGDIRAFDGVSRLSFHRDMNNKVNGIINDLREKEKRKEKEARVKKQRKEHEEYYINFFKEVFDIPKTRSKEAFKSLENDSDSLEEYLTTITNFVFNLGSMCRKYNHTLEKLSDFVGNNGKWSNFMWRGENKQSPRRLRNISNSDEHEKFEGLVIDLGLKMRETFPQFTLGVRLDPYTYFEEVKAFEINEHSHYLYVNSYWQYVNDFRITSIKKYNYEITPLFMDSTEADWFVTDLELPDLDETITEKGNEEEDLDKALEKQKKEKEEHEKRKAERKEAEKKNPFKVISVAKNFKVSKTGNIVKTSKTISGAPTTKKGVNRQLVKQFQPITVNGNGNKSCMPPPKSVDMYSLMNQFAQQMTKKTMGSDKDSKEFYEAGVITDANAFSRAGAEINFFFNSKEDKAKYEQTKSLESIGVPTKTRLNYKTFAMWKEAIKGSLEILPEDHEIVSFLYYEPDGDARAFISSDMSFVAFNVGVLDNWERENGGKLKADQIAQFVQKRANHEIAHYFGDHHDESFMVGEGMVCNATFITNLLSRIKKVFNAKNLATTLEEMEGHQNTERLTEEAHVNSDITIGSDTPTYSTNCPKCSKTIEIAEEIYAKYLEEAEMLGQNPIGIVEIGVLCVCGEEF